MLGSHLIYILASQQQKIRVLKRPASDIGRVKRIFSIYEKEPDHFLSNVEFVDGDLLDIQSIDDALKDVKEVYHCAAMVSFQPGDRKKMIHVNQQGTANLVNACLARQKIRHEKAMGLEKIQRLEEEKKLMTAKMLLEGQEEERKRIARELHDGLGVLLSATKMQFTTIKNISPENGHIIDRATQLLEQATGDVRKISHNMMPGLLTKLGLYEAVEDLFENLNDADNIHAAFEITGEDIRLPENNEIMLYRVIQEMVNNTLKHAEASEIKLIINVIPDRMDLIYFDNGKGFDMVQVFRNDADTLGLKSIRSRIGFLNGKIDIDSRPGRGTRFAIEIPVG